MVEAESIRGRLIAVAPTPLHSRGDLHREGLRRLVSNLAGSNLAGIAIGTPLGRGDRLSIDLWSEILATWREGLDRKTLLMASVGASRAIRRPDEVIESTLAMARRAADLGADALIVQPPGAFRGKVDRDRLVLEYHSALADAGMSLVLSYRRELSGGIAYGPDVLAQLVAKPEVLGIEIATIDGIVTFQQIVALTRELAPTKLVISGEERFLGYSLMCGADAAMVGIASAFPGMVGELLDAHFGRNAEKFLKCSQRVDELSLPIFRSPLEGSPQRLLSALVHLGIIPAEAACDPWGPQLGRGELEHLGRTIDQIRRQELAN